MIHLLRNSFSFSSHHKRKLFLTTSLTLLSVQAASFYSSSSLYDMKPYTVHRDSSTGIITITPKKEHEQSALVVISHGLGDSSEGFADVAEHLATQLPHCKFILPTAPTQPVTMNMGMPMPSWYDITGLDERSNENCKGIHESKTKIASILQNEHETNQLSYSRMVLAGFSQGGALSLFTGMQLESSQQKLAGIVVLSGYLPAAKQFTITDGLHETPILHCHGSADPMVHVSLAKKSQQALLEQKGAKNYDLKLYSGLPHSVNMDELNDVLHFLKNVIPNHDDEQYRVTLKDPNQMSMKELKDAVKKAGLSQQAIGFMEKSEFVNLIITHRSNN